MTYYQDATVTLHHGDCLDVLRGLPDASVDSVVTDPPYSLGFMGRKWDTFKGQDIGRGALARSERAAEVTPSGEGHSTSAGPYLASGVDSLRAAGLPFQQWCELWAAECLRVLKPGGHLLAFGGTRTFHRLACAVEDAGFEIRDSIAWLYGSGFPKSLDVSKAIDKAAGAQREVVGHERSVWHPSGNGDVLEVARSGDTRPLGDDGYQLKAITAPATDDARTWQGWGTALKPAFEPVVVGRKPLSGTVAGNVLAHGTGALNVDACRIEHASEADLAASLAKNPGRDDTVTSGVYGAGRPQQRVNTSGRWPANVVLDEFSADDLDEMSGEQRDGTAGARTGTRNGYEGGWGAQEDHSATYGGSGGASRYFYTAKASSSERIRHEGTAHPTVKPLSLMRWLVRLVCPPGGVVLEPFAGSGTTVEACILEGFRCIAIEREADYLPLITQRINRQRDPIAYTATAGEDLGLFGLEDVS